MCRFYFIIGINIISKNLFIEALLLHYWHQRRFKKPFLLKQQTELTYFTQSNARASAS
jgi:hypothetical protein